MIGLAKVCAAIFGTAGVVNGLACTPTGPASMAVQIGAGEIYQLAPIEATTCGTLPANTAYNILKQGIQLGSYTTTNFSAPGTAGQSINYLIEAQYADLDLSVDPTTGTTPVVLQFYNSTNPAVPWSGPSNSGTTSNTFRDGVVSYQIVPGVAAATGTQTTPSPSSGWLGLWVVTVAYGQTTIVSGNIAQYSGAPFITQGPYQTVSGSAAAVAALLPSGTRLAFQQSAAPTGWTKDTTLQNDSVMRFTTGTVGAGGSQAFTTWNGLTATGAHTLTTAEIPAHTHTATSTDSGHTHGLPMANGSSGSGGTGVATISSGLFSSIGNANITTTVNANTGGGGSHTHPLTNGVLYNDFIVAQKN